MKKKLCSVALGTVALLAIGLWPTAARADDGAGTPSAHLFVRFNNQFVFDGNVPLPTSTLITFHNSNTSTVVTSTVAGSSVFTLLATADEASAAFAISDLSYDSNFDSFYVRCITPGTTTTPACDGWNYVVNNAYPPIGMSNYTLTGGENVYVYFGNPWSITSATTTLAFLSTTKLAVLELTTGWATPPIE